MLGDFGEVLVMDWGLAKARARKEDPAAIKEAVCHHGADDLSQSFEGATQSLPRFMRKSRLPRVIRSVILQPMSTVTVNLPDPLSERLALEARNRSMTPDAIVLQALEKAFQGESIEPQSVFERLKRLSVNDPESPVDLATNPAHMEGFGVSRPA